MIKSISSIRRFQLCNISRGTPNADITCHTFSIFPRFRSIPSSPVHFKVICCLKIILSLHNDLRFEKRIMSTNILMVSKLKLGKHHRRNSFIKNYDFKDVVTEIKFSGMLCLRCFLNGMIRFRNFT